MQRVTRYTLLAIVLGIFFSVLCPAPVINRHAMHVDELRTSLQSFGVPDYVVFCLMLAICAVIGIYFCLQLRRESKQLKAGDPEEAAKSAASYLVGGRKMKIFPITMSLISR